MTAVESFGLAVLAAGLVGLAAVFSNRLSARLHIPAPAIFRVSAAIASDLLPQLGSLGIITVEQVVTVTLAVILFSGGMHIGWRRFRPAAATLWLGVTGTLVTAAAVGGCGEHHAHDHRPTVAALTSTCALSTRIRACFTKA